MYFYESNLPSTEPGAILVVSQQISQGAIANNRKVMAETPHSMKLHEILFTCWCRTFHDSLCFDLYGFTILLLFTYPRKVTSGWLNLLIAVCKHITCAAEEYHKCDAVRLNPHDTDLLKYLTLISIITSFTFMRCTYIFIQL